MATSVPGSARPQFSLRWLFVLVTLSAVLSWAGVHSHRAREAARNYPCVNELQNLSGAFHAIEPEIAEEIEPEFAEEIEPEFAP